MREFIRSLGTGPLLLGVHAVRHVDPLPRTEGPPLGPHGDHGPFGATSGDEP